MFVSSQSLEMPFSVQAIEYFAMVCSHQVYHGGWELVFGLNLGFQLTVTLIKDKNKQTNNKKPKETNKSPIYVQMYDYIFIAIFINIISYITI